MNNVEVETHLFSYRYKGKEYGIDIPAESAEEAQGRLEALAWAKYDGVLVAKIPANMGPLARIIVTVRNALKSVV